MTPAADHVEYVRTSSVRSAVLTAVYDAPRSTTDLVADLDASESAVYAGVNALAERGLLADSDGDWTVTGLGALVWDCLDRERKVQRLLAADETYWERHDPTAIPPRHRRFEVFADATVLRATDADPHRVTRAVADRIRDADRAWVLAAIYHPEFAAATETCSDARIVVDRSVPDAVDEESEGASEVPVRVGEVPFSLTVTDDCTLLSLPRLDGSYDARSELVAESTPAVEWATDLFETYWADAMPVADTV